VSQVIALPIFIPLIAGALSLALWQFRVAQRWVAVIGTGALMASTLWLLYQVWIDGI